MEVFDREVRGFLTVKPAHTVQLALWRTSVRNTAQPFVAQPVHAFGLVTDALTAEVPARQADHR